MDQTMSPKIKTLRQPFSGIYSLADAALFIRATTPPPETPLSLWERRRKRFVGPSSRHIANWVRRSGNGYLLDNDGHLALTFEQLIRARMIVLFRTRGLPLRVILESEKSIRESTGKPQPFVTEALWSSDSDMFYEFEKSIRAATKPGQGVFDDIIRQFMTPIHHGIVFNESGISTLWNPEPGVVINPQIQFGSPVIAGTRIETEAIWSFRQTGTSADALARLYKIDTDSIDAALRWEEILARAA